MIQKIKLFTDSDLDGLACGIIGMGIYGDNVSTVYSGPKQIDKDIVEFLKNEDVAEYSIIYVTDLTISKETATLLDDLNKNNIVRIKLFDHHRTGYFLNKYQWARVTDTFHGDIKTCGAELFWEYMKDIYPDWIDPFYTNMNNFIEYVRLWDTWDWVEAGEKGLVSKKFNLLRSIYSNSKFVNSIFKKICESAGSLIDDTENNLIEVFENKKNRYIQLKAKNARIMDFDNYKVAFVFAEENVSELGNFLCKEFPEIDFAMMVMTDMKTVSLRAIKNEIDLSVIAKKYGGGGHPKSAGFTYSADIEKLFIENILTNNLN